MIDRMDRVCEAIKREISLILQEEANDSRLRDVSITRVDVSRDLRTAKVYYLGAEDEEESGQTEKAFKKAGGFIRAELAKRIHMKFTPRLIFLEDKEEEMEESIEKTFEKIEKEHKEHEEGTENEQ